LIDLFRVTNFVFNVLEVAQIKNAGENSGVRFFPNKKCQVRCATRERLELFLLPPELRLPALELPLLFLVDDRPLELDVFLVLLRDDDEELLAVRPPLFALLPLVVRLPPELDLLDVFRPPEADELDRDLDEPPRPFPFELDDVRFDFADDDELRDLPDDDEIVSAAAPTAPTAAPAAAPESISPATSMTLSTIFDDVDFRDPEDLRADDDEPFLFDVLELVLLAIVSP
jgi:hypothetical protein